MKRVSKKVPVKTHKSVQITGWLFRPLLLLFAGMLVFMAANAQPPNPAETDSLAPYITSVGILSVTASSANMGGNVTGNGGVEVTERGIVYSSSNTLPTTAGDTKIIIGSGNGPYSQTVAGLRGGTTYYVRAYAINIIGTSYGAVISFTTSASPPVIETNEITAIGNNSATAGGNISYSSGAAVTDRGIVYSSVNSLPGLSDTKIQVGSGTGSFSQSITGLTQGIMYYVRAYATNSAGTGFGTVVNFTPAGATVSTDAVFAIGVNTATIGGNVTSAGSSAVTDRGILYKAGNNIPTIADSKISIGSGVGTFSQDISSLLSGTTYSVRAFATNGTATNYGGVQAFTTQTTLTAINRVGAAVTNSAIVNYTVVFAQSITGLADYNFSLTSSGVSNAFITTVSGSGTTWTVTVYTGTGSGTLALNLVNSLGISPGIGNSLPFIGQTVTIDKTPPVLTNATIVSNNTNTAMAKAGDIVTVGFTASETINTPTVTIGGNAAVVNNTSANNFTASYTMKATDTEGPVAFQINFSDVAGNAGDSVKTTTNSSSVAYDKTPPTVSSSNLAGSSPTNTATVQFVLSFSEPVTGVDVSDFVLTTTQAITGVSVTAVTGTGGAYTVTVNAGTGTGTIRLDLKNTGTGIADIAGNACGGFTSGQVYSILRKPIVKTNNPAAVCSPLTVDLTAAAVTAGSDGGLTFKYYTDVSATTAVVNAAAITVSGVYYITGINVLNAASDPVGVTVTVNAFQLPKAAFSFDSYCIGKPVKFSNTSIITGSGTVNYQWSDNAGNSSITAAPTFTYSSAGNYSVKLKVSSQSCPLVADSSTQSIGIVSPTPAQRMPSVNTQINDPAPLQARNFGTGYVWSPVTGLSSATISNPTVTTAAEREYTITITAASSCLTVDTLLVRIFDKYVYVPNVFSPNGDGINDILYVNLVSVKQLRYFRVFNRYGKKVFESSDPASGWNGKLNGEYQPVDTYVWTVEALDKNGNQINQQGTLSLLR